MTTNEAASMKNQRAKLYKTRSLICKRVPSMQPQIRSSAETPSMHIISENEAIGAMHDVKEQKNK